MEKNFDYWNDLKKYIDTNHNCPTFREREIWWCRIGLNIGHEENGKGEDFSRPVLILRKYNNHLFFGVPLTTKIKENPYYHKIIFKGLLQCAMMSQERTFESKRITDKLGKITTEEFEKLREYFRRII